MDSLQELVKERKFKMHQKESWQFNDKYDAIIKNTLQNRTVNIEKSIPTPHQESQDQLHNFNYLIHANSNENYRGIEQQIVAGSGVGDGAASGEGQIQPFDESSSGLAQPEQQIISRSDLSMQLRRQVDQVQS